MIKEMEILRCRQQTTYVSKLSSVYVIGLSGVHLVDGLSAGVFERCVYEFLSFTPVPKQSRDFQFRDDLVAVTISSMGVLECCVYDFFSFTPVPEQSRDFPIP